MSREFVFFSEALASGVCAFSVRLHDSLGVVAWGGRWGWERGGWERGGGGGGRGREVERGECGNVDGPV